MTTVAYSDGIMASDSKCTNDGYFTTKAQKIYPLANNTLFGAAGDADTRAVRDILGAVRSINKLPSRQELADTQSDVVALWVWPNGRVFYVDIYHIDIGANDSAWAAQVVELKERFGAVGSGEQFALGAMAAGKSASQAVAIACRYDSFSGLPIHTVKLEQPKRKKPRKKAA